MAVEIIDCVQNEPEWYEARRGIPTASQFKSILAKGQGKMRHDYMTKLAGEIITGLNMPNFQSRAMIRGKEKEAVARKTYAFMYDADPVLVGFMRTGNMGCSPDSLLGDDGMLEVKTSEAHLLIDIILKDEFVKTHLAQCQGQLMVAERQWLDLVVYSKNMDLFVKRITRDIKYIANLRKEIDLFNIDLANMVEAVHAKGRKMAA